MSSFGSYGRVDSCSNVGYTKNKGCFRWSKKGIKWNNVFAQDDFLRFSASIYFKLPILRNGSYYSKKVFIILLWLKTEQMIK